MTIANSFRQLAISGTGVSLALNLLTPTIAAAANFTFTKIADTNTLIPGRNTNFAFAHSNIHPAISGGTVVFAAANPSSELYKFTENTGNLELVVERGFINPSHIAIDGDTIGLSLNVNSKSTAYTKTTALNLVADVNTPIPGMSDPTGVAFSAISGDNVVFRASGLNERRQKYGIYLSTEGSISVIADTETPIPEGVENFSAVGRPAISGDNVAFLGFGEQQRGVYLHNGSLSVVADKSTPVPGAADGFLWFFSTSISGDTVAFTGNGVKTNGIYTFSPGEGLNMIANSNTLLPEGGDNFSVFYDVSVSGDYVAFKANTRAKRGIYTNWGGSLSRVIGVGDILDNKLVAEVDFGRFGFSGDSLVFYAKFADGSAGIFSSTARGKSNISNPRPVPEPTSVLGMVAFGFLGTGSLLNRKRKSLK